MENSFLHFPTNHLGKRRRRAHIRFNLPEGCRLIQVCTTTGHGITALRLADLSAKIRWGAIPSLTDMRAITRLTELIRRVFSVVREVRDGRYCDCRDILRLFCSCRGRRNGWVGLAILVGEAPAVVGLICAPIEAIIFVAVCDGCDPGLSRPNPARLTEPLARPLREVWLRDELKRSQRTIGCWLE